MPRDMPANQAEFRTVVPTPANPLKIGLTRPVLVLGSCFAEHMATRLERHKFAVCAHPTGLLYNPLSIESALRRITTARRYSRDELFEHEGLWKCFDHHSRFDSPARDVCLDGINSSFGGAVAALENIGTLIVTFGTSFVYRKAEDGRLVANCHRLPQNLFTRSLVRSGDIVDLWTSLIEHLYERIPALSIILTVSPVRHLRDDPHENQVSKAHLMTTAHELECRFPSLHYFPAYEIMMDELRDYRFYEADMAHPSPVAVNYLWHRFVEACVDSDSAQFVRAYDQILQARDHRTQHAGRAAAIFAARQLERIASLRSQYPHLAFDEDRAHFEALLDRAREESTP